MSDTRSRLATSRASWLPSETGPTLADLEPGAAPATPSGLLRGIVASHPSAVVVVDAKGRSSTPTDIRCGYDLLVAADPIEALAIVEGHPARIHLLVSDVVMPMLSGPELARRLRELRPEIRTLFLSGYTEELVGSKG